MIFLITNEKIDNFCFAVPEHMLHPVHWEFCILYFSNFSGFSSLSLNHQMGLLRGSWSEVFTLSIIFRSLPTTVAAASLAAREVSSGNKRKLKFAPDYAMTQNIANKCGLQAFYEQVRPKNILYVCYSYELLITYHCHFIKCICYAGTC